jgi:hypothetical protein
VIVAAVPLAFWFGSVLLALCYLATFFCVADALRIPDDAWKAAEQRRQSWIIVMLVLPVVFVVYWFSIRPQLFAAAPEAP